MSLMGIITGGMSDVADAEQKKDAMDKAYGVQSKAAKEHRRLTELSLAEMRPFYDLGLPAFKSYMAGITGGIDPNTGHTWTPTNSPAFQWQQEQANKATNRSLRALGRSNSTFGANTIANSNRNLAAGEYDRQLGRLEEGGRIAMNAGGNLANIRNRLGTNALEAGNTQANYLLGLSALKSNQIGEFDKGIGQAAGVIGSLYGGGLFSGGKGGGNSLSGMNNSYGVMQNNAGYKWDPNTFGG